MLFSHSPRGAGPLPPTANLDPPWGSQNVVFLRILCILLHLGPPGSQNRTFLYIFCIWPGPSQIVDFPYFLYILCIFCGSWESLSVTGRANVRRCWFIFAKGRLVAWVHEITIFLRQSSTRADSTSDAFRGRFYKPNFQNSGFPDFRNCGIPEFWKSGNPDLRNSAFAELRICGNPKFPISGNPDKASN